MADEAETILADSLNNQPTTTNDIPTNSGAVTLIGGDGQVTLLSGTGEESILSGSIESTDVDNIIISRDGKQMTLVSSTGEILTDGDDSGVTVVGGADNNSESQTANTADATEEAINLDFLHSGNGSAQSPLKRMELVYKDTVMKFAINPSDYTQKEPNRATITQTKGGAWIDAWGAGIVEFTIKGITGVSGVKMSGNASKVLKVANTLVQATTGNNGVDVGYQRWKALRDLFREVYNEVQDGEPVTELIKLYNYTDNEFWYCYPTQAGIELYRSRSKPHIYQYTINLWGIRRIGEPETTVGVIGNPNKEQATSEVDTTSETDDAEETVSSDQTTETTDTDPDKVEEGEVLDGSGESNLEDDTTTVQDTTATVSGGNAYVTKTASPGTQADVTIITNTRTKTNAIIRDQAKTYAQALSPIIGGHNGQLSPKTAYNCAKDVMISDSGIVLNVKGFDARTLDRDYVVKDEGYVKFHRLMEEVLFAALVSKETYVMQQQILDYSPLVLSPEYVLPIGSTPRERVMQAVERSTKLDSTLYRLITKYQPKFYLSKSDVKYLKMVMLECMMVYRQMTQIAESQGQPSTTLTTTSMRTLIKNLDALIIYLEFNSTDTNEFFVRNIMWELRKIEYIIVQIAADIVEYL